jgi:mutator protein MutT
MAIFNCRVSGVLLNDKEEVLLVRRNRSYITDNKNIDEYVGWEFCGGGIEHGEAPDKAIEREYKEEVGIKISAIAIFSARSGERDNAPLLNLSYMCKYISGAIILTKEHTDFKWVSIKDLSDYDLGPHTNIDKRKFIEFFLSMNRSKDLCA